MTVLRSNGVTNTAAPADSLVRRPWSPAMKVAAYVIFTALAIAAIWLIDTHVQHRPADQPSPAAVR